MTPRRFLVFAEPLPKTRSGKINYPRLKELALEEDRKLAGP
jgi:acyl-coenzyme A synthetase/AMP-(fatty) acid ligase